MREFMDKLNYSYDYTKTMMMKMLLAEPDKNGGSKVYINIENALELIKKVDALTLGIPKIIYLVGWQYLGHDDKYPDFFEGNKAIKRAQDKTANDSIIWLMNEAKKYNTIVSFHINFNDAYDNAPSFDDYVKNNALIRKKNGQPHAIERYNDKNCYKVCLKGAWESGLFKRQVDKLLSLFPLEEMKTVHVDNFQCYKNYSPNVSIDEMSDYREKMIDYLREKNIDITSEFTYREHKHLKNKPIFGLPREHGSRNEIKTLGKIPAVWWLNYMTNADLVNIAPQLFSGGMFRKNLLDFGRADYIYENMQGEDIFKKMANGDTNWAKEFLHCFATKQVPYQFLCQYKRLSITGRYGNYTLNCADNVSSVQKKSRIFKDKNCLKDGATLCLPLLHRKNIYLAYSKDGDTRKWTFADKVNALVNIYELSEQGPTQLYSTRLIDNHLSLTIKPTQGLILEFI